MVTRRYILYLTLRRFIGSWIVRTAVLYLTNGARTFLYPYGYSVEEQLDRDTQYNVRAPNRAWRQSVFPRLFLAALINPVPVTLVAGSKCSFAMSLLSDVVAAAVINVPVC